MGIRSEIKPPRFQESFAVCDLEAEPFPSLSLFPPPLPAALADWEIELPGGARMDAERFLSLPRVVEKRWIVCQIFNWWEEVVWEGARLADLLAGADLPADARFLTFHSADGRYFESLPIALARDPRVLLAYGMNGAPLPHAHGGPLRLVVPFLQAYKSVKWLSRIGAEAQDPKGIKRILGQAKTAVFTGPAFQEMGDSVTMMPTEEGSLAEI